MKHRLLFITALAVISCMFACSDKDKEVEPTLLVEQNVIDQHPEWLVSKEPIVKEFTMTVGRQSKYKVPMRLTWQTALDTVNTYGDKNATGLFVAAYKLERMGGSKKIEIGNVNVIPLSEAGVDRDNSPIWWEHMEIVGSIQFPQYETSNYGFVYFDALGNCKNPQDSYKPY